MDPAGRALISKTALEQAGLPLGGQIQSLSVRGTFFAAGPAEFRQFESGDMDLVRLKICAEAGTNHWRAERIDLNFEFSGSMRAGSISLKNPSAFPQSIEHRIERSTGSPVVLCRVPFTWPDINVSPRYPIQQLAEISTADEGHWLSGAQLLRPGQEHYDGLSEKITVWFQGNEFPPDELPQCPVQYLDLSLRLLEIQDSALSSELFIPPRAVFDILNFAPYRWVRILADYVAIHGEASAISLLGGPDFECVSQGQIPYRANCSQHVSRNQIHLDF